MAEETIREAVSPPRGLWTRLARAMLYRIKLRKRKELSRPAPELERAHEELRFEEALDQKYKARLEEKERQRIAAEKQRLREEQLARERKVVSEAHIRQLENKRRLLESKCLGRHYTK